MKTPKWGGRALGAVLLAASLGACDYINISDDNPNIVSSPTIDQLWVSTQLNAFLVNEGHYGRVSAVWLQQGAGTDRQFAILDQYSFTESDFDGEMAELYSAAGLVAIEQGKQLAADAGCPGCAALFQIHEAFTFGIGASFFGDIPFAEAVNPDVVEPALDPQEEVYAALQGRLDDAIAGLAGPEEPLYAQMASADLNFSGDRARWTAVAWTLKARLYIEWAEAQMAGGAAAAAAQTACGGDCIQKAIDAAQKGIMTPAGNWTGIHSTATTEQNLFYQFIVVQREGYLSAGEFGVNLLKDRDDPRLPIYFLPDEDGEFTGSAPGEGNSSVSSFNTDPGGLAGAAYPQLIVSCSENAFILAEANYYKGNTAAAQAALQAGVACQEQLFGFTGGAIPVMATLTGQALLEEIITQKYISQFLNPVSYADYRRTCLPDLQTFNNQPIPARVLYGATERQANRNVPSPDAQPARNTFDPNPCP